MSYTLHFHPLSSYSMKALIGLYELGIPFDKVEVNYGDEKSRDAFFAIAPIGKIPVLRDEAKKKTVAEVSVILEYIGKDRLVPADFDRALECRYVDRFYDCYVMTPMQKHTDDLLRGDGKHDPTGVARAGAALEKSYRIEEARLAHGGPWAMGNDFTLADCAAAPSLFYAEKYVSLKAFPRLDAYYRRLLERPSFARCLEEAKPYFKYFPGPGLSSPGADDR